LFPDDNLIFQLGGRHIPWLDYADQLASAMAAFLDDAR
jgi:hypothetical protein